MDISGDNAPAYDPGAGEEAGEDVDSVKE